MGNIAIASMWEIKHKDEIRAILDKHRKEPLSKDWLPLAGFCDDCGKDDLTFDWQYI